MRELLDELAEQADIVLLDCPPVLPVTDSAVLAQSVDGVLLVVDAGSTRRGAAQQAVDELKQVGANLIGVALNKVSARTGGYYSYGAYYGDGKERKKSRGERMLTLFERFRKQKPAGESDQAD
jgi:Mrp family chromosome partitioning ATPase